MSLLYTAEKTQGLNREDNIEALLESGGRRRREPKSSVGIDLGCGMTGDVFEC